MKYETPGPFADPAVDKALAIAMRSGGVDGNDHKMWVIDQMVRALTRCPTVRMNAFDHRGEVYHFDGQGESPAYLAWVAEHNAGDDGPNTYEWETGTAP